jgi:hypothetical protein
VQPENPRLQLLGSGGFSPPSRTFHQRCFLNSSDNQDLRHFSEHLNGETHKPLPANSLEGDEYIKGVEHRTPRHRPSLDYLFRESALTFLRGQSESR